MAPKNREPVKPVVEEEESDSEASSEEAGSDEEEEVASDEEVESSDSEPEKPQITTSLKKPEPEESDSEESDSEEPDSQPIKPLASKPMETPSPKKPKSKSLNTDIIATTPVKSIKRPAENSDKPDKSKKKTKAEKPEPEPESPVVNVTKSEVKKTPLFQRLWSEDDEIEILKGMIEYDGNPVSDIKGFHDYIRKNLSVDVTNAQVSDKIRRLKKKYMNNKGKEKVGKDRVFSNVHEGKTYELSKKVWGSVDKGKENGVVVVVKKKGENGVAVVNDEEGERGLGAVKMAIPMGVECYGSNVEGRIERLGAELFETGKGLEGERMWKKLNKEEIVAYQKLMEVKNAKMKLVVEYMDSGDL